MEPHAPILAADLLALEREMRAKLVLDEEDGEGHLAFALHRRALLDWLEAFEKVENRLPGAAEMRVFLLGEKAERRQEAYREQAARLLAIADIEASAPRTVKPPPTPRLRTWFWPWGFSTGFALEDPQRPLDWKGLFWRLSLLGLAVIVTALALRIFVVRA